VRKVVRVDDGVPVKLEVVMRDIMTVVGNKKNESGRALGCSGERERQYGSLRKVRRYHSAWRRIAHLRDGGSTFLSACMKQWSNQIDKDVAIPVPFSGRCARCSGE